MAEIKLISCVVDQTGLRSIAWTRPEWGLQHSCPCSVSCLPVGGRVSACKRCARLWAGSSVWEKGLARSWVTCENPPSAWADCFCLLRGEGWVVVKERASPSYFLREQHCGQKFPGCGQSQKLEQKDRRNPPSVGKKSSNCNDKLCVPHWEFYRGWGVRVISKSWSGQGRPITWRGWNLACVLTHLKKIPSPWLFTSE